MATPRGSATYLSRSSWVPIGLVGVIVTCAVAGTAGVMTKLSAIEGELRTLNMRIDGMAAENSVRFENWTLRFRAMNPALNIPDWRRQE